MRVTNIFVADAEGGDDRQIGWLFIDGSDGWLQVGRRLVEVANSDREVSV